MANKIEPFSISYKICIGNKDEIYQYFEHRVYFTFVILHGAMEYKIFLN